MTQAPCIKVICIKKFKDKNGKIVEYLLVDSNGQQQTINAYQLKMNIKAGLMQVSNLKLTSDDRLVENKDNGETIKRNKSNGSKINNEIAKAIILLRDSIHGSGKHLVEDTREAYIALGLSFIPYSKGIAYDKEIAFSYNSDEDNYYYNKLLQAIRCGIQSESALFIIPYIEIYANNLKAIYKSLTDSNTYDISKHPVVKAIDTIESYVGYLAAKNNINYTYHLKIKEIKDNINNVDLTACKVGNTIGKMLSIHLNMDYFNTNNIYSVGYVTIPDDIENSIGAYIAYESLYIKYRNSDDDIIDSGYAIVFNTLQEGIVRARILKYSIASWTHKVRYKDLKKHIDINRKKQDMRSISNKIAQELNKLASDIVKGL